jgi:hypothetical protein
MHTGKATAHGMCGAACQHQLPVKPKAMVNHAPQNHDAKQQATAKHKQQL